MMENKEKNIDSSMDDELKSTLAYHEDDASPLSADDHEEVVQINEEVYGTELDKKLSHQYSISPSLKRKKELIDYIFYQGLAFHLL